MTNDDVVSLLFALMTFLSSGFLLVTSVGKCVSSLQPDRFIVLSLALSETLLAPFCLTIIVKTLDMPPYQQDDPISMLLANYVIYFENTIYCIGLIELAVEFALRNKLKFLLRSKTIRWIVSLVAGSFPWIVVSLMAIMSPRGVDPDTWQHGQSVTVRRFRIVMFNLVPAAFSILACTLVQLIRPDTHGLKEQPTDESIQIQVIANAPDKDLVSDFPIATLPPPVTNFELAISQGVQPTNDPAVMNLRAFTAYADEKTKDTPSNRQQVTQTIRQQDPRPNRQQDTEFKNQQDTEFNRQQDLQPNRQQDTAEFNRQQDLQSNRQQDPQPNRQQDTEFIHEQDTEFNCQQDTELNHQQDTQPNRQQDPQPNRQQGQQGTKFNRKQDTQANRKQDTQSNRKQDTQANRKQNTQANRKQDTQANRKQDTPANRKQDTQANRKQDTQVNRKQNTQVNRKQDTQANRKQNTQVNRKQDTQVNRKQDTQANRKQNTQVNRKQDTQANRKQCELISVCALAEKMSVKMNQNDKQRLVDTSVQNVQNVPTALTEKTQKSVLMYSAIVPCMHTLRCVCWLILDEQSASVDFEATPSDGLGIFAIKGVLFSVIAIKALMMTPFVMSFWYL
ncbi:unnamed protein product [Lymnaea stagnalis]|uniref:Zonadhesin n=1 Tax=Lymnaea stagnalis TaxID=6523 RepID=A0AAV2IAX8_LYMST